MLVKGTEIPQNTESLFRQRNQAVFVALGITDMNPHVMGVDITDCKVNPFSETQPHTVYGEEKDSIAQSICCCKEIVKLISGEDIRDSCCFWWFDQGNINPCFFQNIGIEKFKAVQIKFDCRP